MCFSWDKIFYSQYHLCLSKSIQYIQKACIKIWSVCGRGLVCLCIAGEWHQYDDIICAEPSKSILKRIKETIWHEQRKSVLEGREIAGKVMLQTIFDFLRSWSDLNLRNFVTQLKQFHHVYGNPFVFEEKEKKWDTLNYTEKDVSITDVIWTPHHWTPLDYFHPWIITMCAIFIHFYIRQVSS